MSECEDARTDDTILPPPHGVHRRPAASGRDGLCFAGGAGELAYADGAARPVAAGAASRATDRQWCAVPDPLHRHGTRAPAGRGGGGPGHPHRRRAKRRARICARQQQLRRAGGDRAAAEPVSGRRPAPTHGRGNLCGGRRAGAARAARAAFLLAAAGRRCARDTRYQIRRRPRAPRTRGGDPELPAGPTPREMIAERLQPLLDKLADAPIDRMFADMQASAAALKDLVNGPQLRGALDELRTASVELRDVVKRFGDHSDALMNNLGETMRSTNRLIDRTGQTLATIDRQVGDRSPLLADIRGLVQQLDGAARSIRLLAEYLERNPDALISGKSDNRR